MASRLPDLIRRARTLSAERDRLVEALTHRWATTLKGKRLSAQDLEEFWAGLTEEAVRGFLKDGRGRWAPEVVRREAVEVIGRVRARVEGILTEKGDGPTHDA
jgi:hypothetical protein